MWPGELGSAVSHRLLSRIVLRLRTIAYAHL